MKTISVSVNPHTQFIDSFLKRNFFGKNFFLTQNENLSFKDIKYVSLKLDLTFNTFQGKTNTSESSDIPPDMCKNLISKSWLLLSDS